MSKIRILGIGSPSGDDQAGWLTIDALRASGVSDVDEVFIEKLDRPGATLVSLLENSAWVILIDAVLIDTALTESRQSNREEGQIQRFDQQEWPNYRQGLSSHGFGVIDALTLARELGCLPAKLDLYGIEISDVMPGEVPGISIRAAAQQLAGLIANDLHQASVLKGLRGVA